MAKDLLLEQLGEKRLREVLRIGHVMSASTQIPVEGIPVRFAQFGEGLVGSGGIAA
jgi:hypothetical protein